MSLSIQHNIAKVWQRIRDAEKKYHRSPRSVQLMVVSKTRTAANIRTAVATGVTHIGENYLQEAMEKKPSLSDLPIIWHFIGPIQSNKTRAVAEHFDWVHSIDRLKIARRLSDQRPSHLPALNVCLQVNISGESSKSGVPLSKLEPLSKQISTLPNIALRGLMALPQASADNALQQKAFAQVQLAAIKMQHYCSTIDTLSMGMSADLEAAIAKGATIVRIGTDIFGPRDKPGSPPTQRLNPGNIT